LGAYSDPDRDPRHHTITVVFVAKAEGRPRASDDAENLGVFNRHALPRPIVFDHARILHDYFTAWRAGKNPEKEYHAQGGS
jgi:ADP-ribose pyrophosphatase YjhB (NUDIX family)